MKVTWIFILLITFLACGELFSQVPDFGNDSITENLTNPVTQQSEINKTQSPDNRQVWNDSLKIPQTGEVETIRLSQITGDTAVLQSDSILQENDSGKAGILVPPQGNNPGKKITNFEKYGYLANDVRSSDNGKEAAFYVACGLLFLLGLFRSFYGHYFSNLASVYFNTSLRQTQLAEQLMQDKLPSFIFNLFFIITAGAFLWLLVLNSDSVLSFQSLLIFEISVLIIMTVYIIKFFFLKFLGWVSGLAAITDRYIFIIFLVNKLLAIVLLPFVILMLFGKPEWMKIYITLALAFSGFLLLSRYIKSYGLIRQNFPVTVFHFLLFFIGAELLPLLIIYKAASAYFTI